MSEVKKCPKCGGELEKGFLNSHSSLWWDTKPHKVMQDGEQLTPSLNWRWSIQNLEAYRCKKCKLIMFEYEEQEDSEQCEQ